MSAMEDFMRGVFPGDSLAAARAHIRTMHASLHALHKNDLMALRERDPEAFTRVNGDEQLRTLAVELRDAAGAESDDLAVELRDAALVTGNAIDMAIGYADLFPKAMPERVAEVIADFLVHDTPASYEATMRAIISEIRRFRSRTR